MFIQTEKTPNPATLKFIPGQTILQSGTAEFRSPEETAAAPLARRLFGITGVKGVFFGQDFISVSKGDDTDWAMLKPMILAALMEHLSTGQPVMLEEQKKEEDEGGDEIVLQIRELINTRVRPAVMMDGGDVVFDSFEDGIVYLRMRGACSGCPSATITLKQGIEGMLKHYVPEVREVRAAED
ncbi:MAG: NifU family protein [Alphaproteobacteria bacterium]|nr:NifU family protein [Alphaproteobacteria bacterium]